MKTILFESLEYGFLIGTLFLFFILRYLPVTRQHLRWLCVFGVITSGSAFYNVVAGESPFGVHLAIGILMAGFAILAFLWSCYGMKRPT